MKYWVIVRFTNGAVKIWRDYGTTWGSPAYTVLGYVTGSYSDAVSEARTQRPEK